MTPEQRIKQFTKKIEDLHVQIDFWSVVREADENQKSPTRERIVIREGEEYIGSSRYEIKIINGWATVQLRDGSILAVQPCNWTLYSHACRYFEISHSDIRVDDPR